MHAAFGISRAAGKKGTAGSEPVWKDLRLEELLKGTTGEGPGGGASGGKKEGGGGMLEEFKAEGAVAGVGRTLQGRRRAEGTAGGRLRG